MFVLFCSSYGDHNNRTVFASALRANWRAASNARRRMFIAAARLRRSLAIAGPAPENDVDQRHTAAERCLSSTAARTNAARVLHARCFLRSFSSGLLAAPPDTATPPANFAKRSCSWRSKSLVVTSIWVPDSPDAFFDRAFVAAALR